MVAFILVSVSMSMPILGSVYKWNYPVFALLCLTYFAQHNVFKAYPCGRVSELLPFYPLHAFASFLLLLILATRGQCRRVTAKGTAVLADV